jgi:hypothetical protein
MNFESDSQRSARPIDWKHGPQVTRFVSLPMTRAKAKPISSIRREPSEGARGQAARMRLGPKKDAAMGSGLSPGPASARRHDGEAHDGHREAVDDFAFVGRKIGRGGDPKALRPQRLRGHKSYGS